MYFHPKMAWPPSIYDVISRNHSNWPSRNLSQNARKGWTNSYFVRCWCFILWEKKTQKIGRGGGGGTGGIQPSLGRWVPVFCFTQFGGAFPCLNFSKLCGTSPLIRFFYPSIAIRYTKSTDLITEESIALITTNRTLTVCSTVSSARNCSGRLIYSMWMFLNLSLT